MLKTDDPAILPGLRMDLGDGIVVEMTLPEITVMDHDRALRTQDRERVCTLTVWTGKTCTAQTFRPFPEGPAANPAATLENLADLFSEAAVRVGLALKDR